VETNITGECPLTVPIFQKSTAHAAAERYGIRDRLSRAYEVEVKLEAIRRPRQR